MRNRQPMRRPRYRTVDETHYGGQNYAAVLAKLEHRPRREGDEMACSCGKRWPVGEDHP